jgi:cytochrome c553
MKIVVVASFLAFTFASVSSIFAQAPTPTVVDSPTVTVLTGLLAPQFQEEMNLITQALGVTCGTCHAPRGNFASDEKPEKLTARRMLEMTRGLNKQFFPDHKPKSGESVLGRVTCYTCHQGERTPKLPPGQ